MRSLTCRLLCLHNIVNIIFRHNSQKCTFLQERLDYFLNFGYIMFNSNYVN